MISNIIMLEVANSDHPIIDEHTLKAPESAHHLAILLTKWIEDLLSLIGLENMHSLAESLYIIVVCLIGVLIGLLIKKCVMLILRYFTKRSKNVIFSNLRASKFFTNLTRIIPALFIIAMLAFAFVREDMMVTILMRACWIYIVFIMALSINNFIYAFWLRFDERENKRKLPLKGLVQLFKGIIWIIAAIIIVSIIVNRSPATLLAGLGAFAAVLMLIFKDSILGVVAGVQLSENDMLRVGDWIKIDSAGANGTVTEVSLTSVKVQNWDKTTTTVPPYSLVSSAFTNYRTMQESGTRRILRVYYIDADSVMQMTDELLSELKSIPLLEPYITKKLEQKTNGKVANVDNPAGLVNGTIDTNLGLFRAYLELYLNNNAHIDQESTHFVTTLEQSAAGIPLQLYCFTNTSSWLPYEAIQAEIFEHLATMLSRFRLYVFEGSTGRDEIINGYLESGGNINTVFGIPEPFFNGNQQSANTSNK